MVFRDQMTLAHVDPVFNELIIIRGLVRPMQTGGHACQIANGVLYPRYVIADVEVLQITSKMGISTQNTLRTALPHALDISTLSP